MAPQKDKDVYLEAVEVTENKSEELNEARYARMASLQKRKYTQGILGCCGKRNTNPNDYK